MPEGIFYLRFPADYSLDTLQGCYVYVPEAQCAFLVHSLQSGVSAKYCLHPLAEPFYLHDKEQEGEGGLWTAVSKKMGFLKPGCFSMVEKNLVARNGIFKEA